MIIQAEWVRLNVNPKRARIVRTRPSATGSRAFDRSPSRCRFWNNLRIASLPNDDLETDPQSTTPAPHNAPRRSRR